MTQESEDLAVMLALTKTANAVGECVVSLMREMNEIEVPEGYDLENATLVYEFDHPLLKPIHGDWEISIRRKT